MYTAIVSVENNRVTKFAEFENEADAQAHVSEYGGIVYEGGYLQTLFVQDGVVTIQEIQETEEQKERRIKAEISAIELQEIMPRKTREIQIQVMEYFASTQGLTPEQLYAVNPAYRGMVDVNNEIIGLRAQL